MKDINKDYINIRGISYKVETVSKIYFRGLTECLRDLSDVDYLNKSAKAIKKVIIPSISNEIIFKSGDEDNEFYLWHSSIEPEEINDIILKIARCFRLQKIEEAKAKGDKEAVKEHEEGLEIINKYLVEDDKYEEKITITTSSMEVRPYDEIDVIEQQIADLKDMKARMIADSQQKL